MAKRALWLVPAAIILLAVVAFAPSLQFKYVQDSYHLVKANAVVERGDILEIFTSDFWKGTISPATSLYRPVAIASYALERRLAGEPSPMLSHLAGIVFHILTALALFLLARRLGASDGAAAAAAMLFTVHPLVMQGVVNVAARGDLLVALFALCALLCFTWAGGWPNGAERSAAVQRLAAWGTALCLFLALCSKELAVVIPLLLIGIDAIYRFPHRRGGGWWIGRAAALAPSAFAGIIYICLRTGTIEGLWGLPQVPAEDNVLVGAQGLPYWATVLAILARYVGLLFFPVGMSGDYSGGAIPLEESIMAPLPLTGLAIACLLVTLAVVPLIAALRGRPAFSWLSVGAMLFVLPYVVFGNVIALNAAAFAERWIYFPAAGFMLIVTAGLSGLAALVPRGHGRAKTIAVVFLMAIILLGIALYTRQASRMWENNLALFRQSLSATPKSLRAYIILGQRHRQDGELQAALDLYEQALSHAPGHAPFWVEKGLTLESMGRPQAAELALREAVNLRPDSGQTQMYLGLALARRGRPEEAERPLRKALLYDPNLLPAAEALGDIAFHGGRYDDAVRYYRACVILGRENLRPKLEAARRNRNAGKQ